MKFEEVLVGLKEDGEDIINQNWNGFKTKSMYVSLQKPDKNSLNTEPYLMMHVGEHKDGGWIWKRFPWIPSVLDMTSETWMYRLRSR